MLKARVPTLLLPRRRYELNEDLWIVRFAQPKIELAVEVEWAALTIGWHLARAGSIRLATELRDSGPMWRSAGRSVTHQLAAGLGSFGVALSSAGQAFAHHLAGGGGRLGPGFRSAGRRVAGQGENIVLFFQWGRVPKEWERLFVAKIHESEARGVPFHDIVKATLPSVIGEAPSFVLLRWVGQKGAKGPRQFVKTVEKTFGKSAKSVIVGLNRSLDPDAMLEVPEEPEEKFRAVIEAIQKADAEKLALADVQEEAIQAV